MEIVKKFLKAFFNFFVGDWIILIGVALSVAVVGLLANLGGLEGLKGLDGLIFFIGIALTLAFTLHRETARKS